MPGQRVGDLDEKIAEALAPLRPQLEEIVARRVEDEIERLVAEIVAAELTRLNDERPRPGPAASVEASAGLKRCAKCSRELPRSAFHRDRSTYWARPFAPFGFRLVPDAAFAYSLDRRRSFRLADSPSRERR